MLKKRLDYTFNLINCFALNSGHIWEDLCIQLNEINNHGLPITITELGEQWIFIHFLNWCFIKDFLMQHMFCCVSLGGRSWRTWRINRIALTHLKGFNWWRLARHVLGPTSHKSLEPWPWNCESPKEVSKTVPKHFQKSCSVVTGPQV